MWLYHTLNDWDVVLLITKQIYNFQKRQDKPDSCSVCGTWGISNNYCGLPHCSNHRPLLTDEQQKMFDFYKRFAREFKLLY
jgi:hypothetical protein